MSSRVVNRPVETRVTVWHCDRCGAELKPCADYGVSRPGEGTSISSHAHHESGRGAWQPLIEFDPEAHRGEYEAANLDLCMFCTNALREWFAEARWVQKP